MNDCTTSNYEAVEQGRSCVKCDEPAKFAGVDVRKAFYCKECFLHMVRNKFRSSLSKRNVFRGDENSRKCLVVFDGSSSSSFLLHQIGEALRQVHFKRLMIEPTIIFLVSVRSEEEVNFLKTKVDGLRRLLPDTVNWTLAHVACCLQRKFEVSFSSKSGVCHGFEMISEWSQVLDGCSSPTYREELVRILKERCLMKIAETLGIQKVMVPDDADELGCLSLSQLCMGRGGTVSSLTDVVELRDGAVFVRPLRDISKKEIAIANHLLGYDEYCIHLIHEKDDSSSIQGLTNAFVNNLVSEGFKSTINTVLSTSGKIHGPESTSTEDRCKFCSLDNHTTGGLCCTCEAIQGFCAFDICSLGKS